MFNNRSWIAVFHSDIHWPSDVAAAALVDLASWNVFSVNLFAFIECVSTKLPAMVLSRRASPQTVNRIRRPGNKITPVPWVKSRFQPHLQCGRLCQTRSEGLACWEPLGSWTSSSGPHPVVVPILFQLSVIFQTPRCWKTIVWIN